MIREKKQFSFLLPAVLTVSLILHMLPQTQVVLREIPERLALAAEAEAKEPVKRKSPGDAADDGNDGTTPVATGAYEDGVYTGSSNGYGGEITVQVTVQNGQITDITILSAPGETDPYFSLAGSLLVTVKQKQTWEVDTVSGATYSSRGILGAIQNALTGEVIENEEAPSVEPVGTAAQDDFKDPAAYKDGTYYGTADGFGGPIKVEVVIQDGKILSIRVTDASDETGEYLSKAKGVIQRILSKGSPNVDSVSGATYSSTGIINAVKRALSQAAADGSKKEVYQIVSLNPAKIKRPAAEQLTAAAETSEYEGGTYYGTADGFDGPIKVEVMIKDGKISSIRVIDAPGETGKYLSRAKDVIQRILRKGSPNVDSVSGATYSSTGIINAVRQALSQAAAAVSKKEVYQIVSMDPAAIPEPATEQLTGDNGQQEHEGGETTTEGYENGTYTDAGWCDDGEEFYYEIIVTIQVEERQIRRVLVTKGEDESDSPEDNEFYLNWAVNGRTRSGTFYPGVPAQIVSSQNAEVDTISGATYSSNTIKSIAARIISAIPVIGSEEGEAQTNDAAGQVYGASELPALSASGMQGGEDLPDGKEDPDSGDPANGGEPADGIEPVCRSEQADSGGTASGREDPDDSEEPDSGGTADGREDSDDSEEPDSGGTADGREDSDGSEEADSGGTADGREDSDGSEEADRGTACGSEDTDDSEEPADGEAPAGRLDSSGEEDESEGEENETPDQADTHSSSGNTGGDGT